MFDNPKPLMQKSQGLHSNQLYVENTSHLMNLKVQLLLQNFMLLVQIILVLLSNERFRSKFRGNPAKI